MNYMRLGSVGVGMSWVWLMGDWSLLCRLLLWAPCKSSMLCIMGFKGDCHWGLLGGTGGLLIDVNMTDCTAMCRPVSASDWHYIRCTLLGCVYAVYWFGLLIQFYGYYSMEC